MLLPGLFAPNRSESSEGKGLFPLSDSAEGGAAKGFGQIFSDFKAGSVPASASVNMKNIAMPFSGGETGQGLPLERQALGFQGIRPESQPLQALQLSLTELGDTIDQLLSLNPEQRAELVDYLESELGFTEDQHQAVFQMLMQWQQTPPSVALNADQLRDAGQEGVAMVEDLREVLDLLNEELSVWVNEAIGNGAVAQGLDSRIESLRENPYLAQWFLGESRPEKGMFNAADWLAQTMQQLIKSASSGSIPMTLEPMRPESLLLATFDTEPKPQTLNLELLSQSRQTRTDARMEGQSLTPADGIPLTPERGQATPSPVEEKPGLMPNLERLQRPIPMAQANQVLTERLAIMIQNEVSRASIRLDPPELGMMDIRIQVQNDQTQIQILVQTPQVREALESQSTRLREFLEQQGLSLADLDVTDQQQQNEQQNDNEQRDGSTTATGQVDQSHEEAELTTKRPLGLVDQFV